MTSNVRREWCPKCKRWFTFSAIPLCYRCEHEEAAARELAAETTRNLLAAIDDSDDDDVLFVEDFVPERVR